MKKTIWRPFTQMQGIQALPHAVSARGSSIFLKNQKAIIDAISSWWVITLGHCEPTVVRAIKKQVQVMDQVLFANFSHNSSELLVKELENLLPKELSYVFFSDDGSTAVEASLKIAIQSWKQKKSLLSKRVTQERNLFLSFTHSYHGDTVGAMSISGPSLFNKPYKKLLFSVIQAKQGVYSDDSPDCYVADFEKKIKQYHKRCAGVIIEPLIQGAGGMIVWPKSAVQEICYLTKKYGLYLIFDEVMTGFGRTGDWFAFQQLGVIPDILCLSKGLTGGFLPLALTVVNPEIYQNFLSKRKEQMLFHGHSFTGNPISCASAVANIKAMKKKNIKKEWERIHTFHQNQVNELKGHKNCRDLRLCGTVVAVEFRVKNGGGGYTSNFSENLTKKALKKGVFLRSIGNIVYILPPYLTTNKQLEQIWSVIKEELNSN